MARSPGRPSVTADNADLRERMVRMEVLQTQTMEMLKEHMIERKLSSVAVEASRAMAEEKTAESIKAMGDRLQKVENDLTEYRVGGKVLMAVGALGISISATVGAIVMKLGIVLGYIKPA